MLDKQLELLMYLKDAAEKHVEGILCESHFI